MEYWIYFICFVAIAFNLYWLLSYVCSDWGKYPPFIMSLGRSRYEVIRIASEHLLKYEKSQKIVDLGCGCGSLLLPLAKKFPQHQFVGIERDIVAYTLMKVFSYKYKNIKVVYGNFMKYEWRDYDVFLCYTGNEIATFISQKIKKEAKEKAIIISETFKMPNLYLVKEIDTNTFGIPLKVFVYRVFQME